MTSTYPGDVKRIVLHRVRHRVDRYGRLYDLSIISTDDIPYYIPDSAPASVMYAIMTIDSGTPIEFTSHRKEGQRRIVTIDLSGVVNEGAEPKCQCCGAPLAMNVGVLVCTADNCIGRGRSRLYRFCTVYKLFANDADCVKFIDEHFDPATDRYDISTFIYTMDHVAGMWYDTVRANLVQMLCNVRNCIQLYGQGELTPGFIILDFVDSLSLPSIDANDIAATLDVASYNGDMNGIFSMFADSLSSRGLDPTAYFRLELSQLEELILLTDTLSLMTEDKP